MDARDLWQKNIVPAFQWTVNALGDAGNFIKTSFARMWSALPRVEIPKLIFLDLKLADFLC